MKNIDKNSFVIDDVFKMIDKKLKKKEKKKSDTKSEIQTVDPSENYVIII